MSEERLSGSSAVEKHAPWVPLVAMFTAASLVDAGFYGQVAAFTPLHLSRLGLSSAEVTRMTGLLASLTWAVGIPFLPLWGALADRYRRKPVIIRSYAAFLAAGLLMIVSRNIWIFALGRAVMSLALGNSGLMMTTLAERVPRHRLGLAFAVMNSAAPIGYFAGPLAGGPMVDAWGLPALLAVNMGLILVAIAWLTFGYRDSYHGRAGGSILRLAVDSLVLIGRSPSLRALFTSLFVLFIGWQAVMPYIPLAALSVYTGNAPATAVGLVVGMGGLAVVAIGPALGAIADRYGRTRTLLAGSVLAAALLPLPALARGLVGMTAAWGAANGVIAAVFALSFTVLSDASTDETRGRVMSFAYLPCNASSVVGAAVGSVVAGRSIALVFPFGALATVLGIGTLTWAAMRLRQQAARGV